MQINNKTSFYDETQDKANYYYGTFTDKIEISYNIKTGMNTYLIKSGVIYHSHNHYRLPITMNPLSYGNLITTYDNSYVSQLDNNNLLIITILDDYNYIELYKKGDKIMEWIDKRISDNKFIRYIGGEEYIFLNKTLIN